MRAVFGVVSLLVVVAIVGLLASQQMKAVQSTSLPAASAQAGTGTFGTPAEQSRQLQDKVRNDVAKALEQGAAARQDADK
jgi:L-fucose isomerase-like protein